MSPSENYVIIQKVDGMREDLHINVTSHSFTDVDKYMHTQSPQGTLHVYPIMCPRVTNTR